ncbi:MAG: MFS transporter [Actinomycetota bacterium]|nr:MFS transporter [Actinomycetota bacterium]
MPSNPVTGVAPATRSTAAILAVVVLVAVNLRLALSSLPAVATLIQDETGWSDAFIGALTTVPVLGMGVFALGVPRLAGRIGRRSAVSLALVAMAAGLTLRLAGAVAVTLLLSAMLAGLSIAILGGLVPGIVRERLSNSMGLATSLWTAAMMGGAALGAALTLPLSDLTGGWNRALAFWALPAVAALVAWLWLERDQQASVATVTIVRLRDLPWRDSTAWALTAFMSVNSVVFYSMLAWTALSYAERGYTPETAGLFFGIFTGSGIIAALPLPAWSPRTQRRRTLFTATVVGCSASLVAIALVPTFAPPLILVALSFTLSGGFAMSLGLLSEYAADAAGSARLTAMAFTITYTSAAFSPFVMGAIMDAVDSWTLVFSLLAGITLLQLPAVFFLRRGRLVH